MHFRLRASAFVIKLSVRLHASALCYGLGRACVVSVCSGQLSWIPHVLGLRAWVCVFGMCSLLALCCFRVAANGYRP